MKDKLIVAVCAHPIIYDTSSYHYRDRNRKDLAWRRISEEVSISETAETVHDTDMPDPDVPEPAAASSVLAGPSSPVQAGPSPAAAPTGPPKKTVRRRQQDSWEPTEFEKEMLKALKNRAPTPAACSEDEHFLLSLLPLLQKSCGGHDYSMGCHGSAPSSQKQAMNASLADVASLAELFAPIRFTPGSGSSCAAAPLGAGTCPSAEALMKLWRT
ncbi:hypothetical protein CRENBAI_017866 [Crenichthys baileyi]|uniref:MADF domain-containing protein n=1 Tax=Crenichthys baileyi TaxID=28760 RepID=A0AAV9RIX0_9TELE